MSGGGERRKIKLQNVIFDDTFIYLFISICLFLFYDGGDREEEVKKYNLQRGTFDGPFILFYLFIYFLVQGSHFKGTKH